MDLEHLKVQIEIGVTVLGALGSMIGSIAIVGWKVSGVMQKLLLRDQETSKTLIQLGKLVVKTQNQIHELHVEIAEMRVENRQREKDTARVDGKIENTNDTMMRLTITLQKACGQLDALWLTLQAIHPDQVPRRASDKG